MRSALAKIPQIQGLTAEPGSPGRVSFTTAKDFDFRKALDAAVADGLRPMKGYKVVE